MKKINVIKEEFIKLAIGKKKIFDIKNEDDVNRITKGNYIELTNFAPKKEYIVEPEGAFLTRVKNGYLLIPYTKIKGHVESDLIKELILGEARIVELEDIPYLKSEIEKKQREIEILEKVIESQNLRRIIKNK